MGAIPNYFLVWNFLIMKKTRESISKSREHKYSQYCFTAKIKANLKIEKIREQNQKNTDYQIAKVWKKYQADLNKKKLEYERKARNELRLLEGKSQREYKQKKRTRNQKLQFALDIAQEIAKLRDTNEYGEAFCISCNQKKSWEELAGGHRWSRRIQGVCLELENINAQCHSCNFTTWPRGDKQAMERVNLIYDQNGIEKYWLERWEELAVRKNQCVIDPKKYAPSESHLNALIPVLIEQNEFYRKQKKFYKPKKKWQNLYQKMIA